MAAAEGGMFMVHQTIGGSVLCCKCGIPMQPNAANMCVKCLRSEIDITEGLRRYVIIAHCPECDSYLHDKSWIKAQLESTDLLALCIKKLNLIKAVRLVHAEFVWTEPHSKRIKVRLRVQKEVLHGAVLEQTYVAEYTQKEQMCEACTRVQANPDQWVAAVQLRQHVPHRRTLFYLEQLILKHGAAVRAIKIKQVDHGMDFFFGNRSHAVKFKNFLAAVAPVDGCGDPHKKLVSQDHKSNNCNYKYTYPVEVSPICREDLVCLPPDVARGLGNIGPLVICTKVTNSIALLDPLTLRSCYLDAKEYWRSPFKSLLTSRQLVEYIVLDVDVDGSKYALADVQVARLSDFGKNDAIFSVKTHLGHLLKPGDHALGYDLYAANCNDSELDKYTKLDPPDAILIKKSYEEKRRSKPGKPRAWKLKSLNMEVDDSSRGPTEQEKMNSEYEEFLRDLEENPDLRFNISLYRDREYQASEERASMTDVDDVPSVPLEELLADLDLSDGEDDDHMSE
ncbi:hypothetical protein Tsubulata_026130 [Turnera subulata]|uniref:60S ribosomal export protein NMD3 n=1 Tax=Turnera subulata TaxID=218843 RepID=A0A9Q0F7J5_9ROSI|nr:hypothetical protein Tsubulata_026130 [Turnera subulata]